MSVLMLTGSIIDVGMYVVSVTQVKVHLNPFLGVNEMKLERMK